MLKSPTVIRRYPLPATEVGQRLKVHRGTNNIHKNEEHRRLFNEGDILTVKKFNDSRYAYGTEMHIEEVEEFKTPEPLTTVILPSEYVVIKNRFDLDPNSKPIRGQDPSYDFRLVYYCEISGMLWETSSLPENFGKVMEVPKELAGSLRLNYYVREPEYVEEKAQIETEEQFKDLMDREDAIRVNYPAEFRRVLEAGEIVFFNLDGGYAFFKQRKGFGLSKPKIELYTYKYPTTGSATIYQGAGVIQKYSQQKHTGSAEAMFKDFNKNGATFFYIPGAERKKA